MDSETYRGLAIIGGLTLAIGGIVVSTVYRKRSERKINNLTSEFSAEASDLMLRHKTEQMPDETYNREVSSILLKYQDRLNNLTLIMKNDRKRALKEIKIDQESFIPYF